MEKASLIQKYNIPGPRYTSYPTVPYWKTERFSETKWQVSAARSFQESNIDEGISIYIHLPFCESLCTFCACHKRITKNHQFEQPYIDALLKEWQLYLQLFDRRPTIKELHLGGGTPTFFKPNNLAHLIKHLLAPAKLSDNYEFSFEAHPNNTTRAHLKTLHDLGFRRISFGVQDYDEKVQKTINRIQPFEIVREVTEWSREIGYTSIGQDLIFGLPYQNLDGINNTIRLTQKLKPDRIAFYSYAHVPWITNVGQRGYNENDLPSGKEKRALYETGKELLSEIGYQEIGMDHFSLPTDALYLAVQNNTLHRNFMGYTPNKTQLMVGLGMSSISDSWYAFSQNLKSVEKYMEEVHQGNLPLLRGHLLTGEDLIVRRHILNIMCHFETTWDNDKMKFPALKNTLTLLQEMRDDGLVVLIGDKLIIPDHARAFVRNVCMAFDLHLIRNKPQTRIFSMTV
ncbi:MAG: oxygen-independent coproporphyrinogen III oxidase [Saprospiraceae bacterium]|nr:oxygen-independent coproporphyrinogen III oxidase [Saprospiraceae bacterium]